ncbi:hypothetical protein ACHAXT_006993 [Thalassiosira profunda]
MAKFTLLALASAVAAASAAAPATKTVKLGNRMLRRGDPGTDALLKKARPYNKAGANRRLEGDGEFEMDGTYNLKFSQCIDVKVRSFYQMLVLAVVSDDNLFDDEVVAYAQAGQVVAVKNFVLFHVCKGDDCFYDQGDYDVFIVDLPTYLANIATYQSNKRVDYCEKCNEFEDFCNAEDEEAAEAEEDAEEEEQEEENEDAEEEEQEDEKDEDEEEDKEEDEEEQDDKDEEEQEEGEEENDKEDEEGEEDDKDRKLKTANRKLSRAAITRKLANYIDCEQCQAYECYVDEENQDENDQEELDNEVSEWIQELAECKETSQQWGNLDLYVGAMCSPYGDTIELAVFVDDACTLYTSQKTFADAYNPYNDNEDGTNFVNYAEDYIKNAFSQVTSCLDGKQPKEFDDPDEEEEEDNGENEEVEYAVNEYCQGIMEGDAMDFNNCQNNNGDNNAAEEDEENENNWYMYDMQEADDIEEVCYTLNQMNGEYSYYYNEELSGTWHERNKKGQIVTNDGSESSMALTPGIIAAIVAAAVIVLAGAAFLCFKPKKKRSDTEAVYQGGEMN